MDEATKILFLGFLFTSLVLFNVSNCTKDVKDKSCTVGLVFAEVAMAALIPYFLYLGYYTSFIGVLLFIILFPILTRKSGGGTCSKTEAYTQLFDDAPYTQTLTWTSEGAVIDQSDLAEVFLVASKNIISLSPSLKNFKLDVAALEGLMFINCTGKTIKVEGYESDFTMPNNKFLAVQSQDALIHEFNFIITYV